MARSAPRLPIALAVLAASLVATGTARATPIGGVVLTEVLFAPSGNDNTRQWVEIYNGTNDAIDMADYSLGWGRDSVTTNTHVFDAFSLAPGATFVIGGPTSNGSNGSPSYDEAFDFVPNLDDGSNNGLAGTIGLFAGEAGAGGTLVHLLVYGESTATTSLLDEQGGAASVLFGTDGFGQGSSVEWTGGETWAQGGPTPGTPALPEPASGTLLGLGLAALAVCGRRSAARGERP